MGEQFIIFHPSSWLATPRKTIPGMIPQYPLHKAASRLLVLVPVHVLGVVAPSYVDGPTSPDTSRTSHKSHGLVRSDICRYITGTIAILWTIKLILVMKTSSSLVITSSRVQVSQVSELQCEEPMELNNSKSMSASILDPP
jgi:hypothetical protein